MNRDRGYWQKRGNKIISFDLRKRKQSRDLGWGSSEKSEPEYYKPRRQSPSSNYAAQPAREAFFEQPERDSRNSPVKPELQQKMLNVMQELGNDYFDKGDFENQDRLVRRLDNMRSSIQKLKESNAPSPVRPEPVEEISQQEGVRVDAFDAEREQIFKENVALKQTLDRKEKEHQRLQKQYETKVKESEEVEKQALQERLHQLQEENNRLRGQVESIRENFFESQKQTQQDLIVLEQEKSDLKKELEDVKQKVFRGQKEKESIEAKREIHRQRMENLSSEKEALKNTIQKIKEEAEAKRKNLLKEKEKVDEMKAHLEELESKKREILRVSDENKEIKNVMLQRIRELQNQCKKAELEREEKEAVIAKEKQKEQEALQRLRELEDQNSNMQDTLRMSVEEKAESSKATDLREKMHLEQVQKIRTEKDLLLQKIEQYKSKVKELETVMNGKKLEMENLDNKLKDLVHSRSLINSNGV